MRFKLKKREEEREQLMSDHKVSYRRKNRKMTKLISWTNTITSKCLHINFAIISIFLIIISQSSIYTECRSFSRANDQDLKKLLSSKTFGQLFPINDDKNFRSPCLLLMSDNEISLFQVPLIDDGNISVVYQLPSREQFEQNESKGRSENETNEGEEDTRREKVRLESNGMKEDIASLSAVYNSINDNNNNNNASDGIYVGHKNSNGDSQESEQMRSRRLSLGKSDEEKKGTDITGTNKMTIERKKREYQQIETMSEFEEVGADESQVRGRDGSNSLTHDGSSSSSGFEPSSSSYESGSYAVKGGEKSRGSGTNYLGAADVTSARSGNVAGLFAEIYPSNIHGYGSVSGSNTKTRNRMKRQETETRVTTSTNNMEDDAAADDYEGYGDDDADDGDCGNRNSLNNESESGADQSETNSDSIGSQEKYARAKKHSRKNGKFVDFDVDMRLGLVFVSDSFGRIHRFRLSSLASTDPESMIEDESSNTINGERGTISNGLNGVSLGSDPDDSKIIENLMPTELSFNEHTFSHVSKSENHEYRSNDMKTSEDERSQATLLNSTRKHSSGNHESDNGNTNPETETTIDRAKLSQHPKVSGQAPKETLTLPRKSFARIIWSRSKFSLSDSSQAEQTADNKSNRKQSDKWAWSQKHQPNSVSQTQTDVDLSDKEESNIEKESSDSTSLRSSHSKEHSKGLRCRLRTQIAVDWLNNVLFVLDKYALLVVDFEGNNELLLIDDFTSINRPVDIKVDPESNFLFWLQQGYFHTTIYKLDLSLLSIPGALERMSSNIEKLTATSKGLGRLSKDYPRGSELTALISHHYAHPIITNLPRHTKLFLIDHKHSRIYVPYVARTNLGSTLPANTNNINNTNVNFVGSGNETDAEVFAPSSSNDVITHMNNSENCNASNPVDGGVLSTFTTSHQKNQILAFNLDGTDVGPLRSDEEQGHMANINDMQDITLDGERGFLYWLTNGGRELFEEYRTKDKADSTFYPAQHNLGGTKYTKVLHYDSNPSQSNQPVAAKPTKSSPIGDLIKMMAAAFPASRWTRSNLSNKHNMDDISYSSLYNSRSILSDANESSRFAHNAPWTILGVTSLLVLVVYLVYAFIFQPQNNLNHDEIDSRTAESFSGRSASFNGTNSPACAGTVSDSDTGAQNYSAHSVGASTNFFGTGTISRWIQVASKPSTSTSTAESIRSGATSTNRESARLSTNYCLESTNNNSCYAATCTTVTSNAIDEHYRRDEPDSPLANLLGADQLANLSEWPMTMNDLSNKLYIPVEVLQDDVLASIRRITIDQLEVERRAPLGEGHFGTVVQGKIKGCTASERLQWLGKTRTQINSRPLGSQGSSDYHTEQNPLESQISSTSGHGSSSASDDFITATNGTTSGDYLTPRSQCNSELSDYETSLPTILVNDSPIDQHQHQVDFRVAIKKLKDNASSEEKRDFLQEAKLLANFDHPNIVHLIGICLDRGSTFIIMELMLGGDLIRYMQENKPRADHLNGNLTRDDLLSICLDIVNGCCYLEELNYIHRDLAARNCLVSSRKREERIVKLADFGLARDIYNDSYYKQLNGSAMPLKWMAPECLSEQKFTTMSDVWSFGVVMWEVLSYCQEKPYGNVEPFFMKEHLMSGRKLEKPRHCDSDMYKLMNQCWQLDPKMRPTFHECRAILIEIRNKSS